MLPLSMADMGETHSIFKITGRDEVRRHLAELGLVVGQEVVVVNSLGGNLILQVKDSRIALDRGLANRIMLA
ncbi:MAG TPA: ferrous iron transport protein A [Candidatus Scatomorpha pullistercoris]|uniref:Ferrous iron transport protein A n=1 Tax=Candidatus Scatomorpha pullistercoris TaxID=2840929 RepID=A0A9D1K7N4_9FIRM|nr:ferrous iron transport protein A [Candidatus Scatomorpha pullistercoris]